MALDTFISYSSKDKTAADAACAVLERAGIRCWIAPRDIRPGQEYGHSIIEAIDQCRVMVLIFSANANDSRQIHREIERAVSKGVPIIPLRIEEVVPTKSMEYFLGAIHWLDALTPPLEKHLQQLAEAVKALLQIDVAGRAAPLRDDGTQASTTVRHVDPAMLRGRTAAPLARARRLPILVLGAAAACIALLMGGVWLYLIREPAAVTASTQAVTASNTGNACVSASDTCDPPPNKQASIPQPSPVTPVEPEKKQQQALPVQPVKPVSPPQNVGAVLPVKPVQPVSPPQNVDVVLPVKPVQPVSPPQNVDVVLPVKPVQPVSPPAVSAFAAFTQTSVKTVFEKHNLLGTFAWDCGQPASKQNHYFVHRLLAADRVQRDMMEGPSTRGFVAVIDKAEGSKPNEITVSGTRDGKPFSSVYRIEPNRMLVLETTVDGKVQVAGGRVPNGGEIPWANRCGG
jgi:TIR domain